MSISSEERESAFKIWRLNIEKFSGKKELVPSTKISNRATYIRWIWVPFSVQNWKPLFCSTKVPPTSCWPKKPLFNGGLFAVDCYCYWLPTPAFPNVHELPHEMRERGRRSHHQCILRFSQPLEWNWTNINKYSQLHHSLLHFRFNDGFGRSLSDGEERLSYHHGAVLLHHYLLVEWCVVRLYSCFTS